MEIENTSENKEISPIDIPTNKKIATSLCWVSVTPYIIFIITLINYQYRARYIPGEFQGLGVPIFSTLAWIISSVIFYLLLKKESKENIIQNKKYFLIATMLEITPVLLIISFIISAFTAQNLFFQLIILIILEIISFKKLNKKYSSSNLK